MLGFLNFEQLFSITISLLAFVVLLDLFVFGRFIFLKVAKKDKIIVPEKTLNLSFIRKIFKLKDQQIKDFKFRLSLDHGLILFNVIVLSFSIYSIHNLFFTSPGVVKTYPEANSKWSNYAQPVEIEFDRPISTKKVTPNTSPEIKGTWIYEKSFKLLPFSRKAKFYPEQSVLPETEVLVYVAGITNHIESTELWEKLLEFRSASLPDITGIYPSDKSTDIPTNSNIEINLSEQDGEFVDWDIAIEPELPHQIVRNFEDKLVIVPTEKFGQGKEYTMTVTRTAVTYDYRTREIVEKKEPEVLQETNFSTVKAPSIELFEPSGTAVMPNSVVRVIFDKEMVKSDVESHFGIEPATEGTVNWEDDKTFLFTPAANLQKATKYTVIFTSGFKNHLGGIVEEDIALEFETIGYVKASISPASGTTRVRRGSNIVISFDQEVDHASAQSKFSISPSVAGTFSWNGNSMIFNPAEDLGWGTKYTATLSAGVKSVHGLDSSATFSSVFTTETQSFVLNVPAYYQTDRFACNLIAAKIVLGYRGIYKSQWQIQSEIGTDPTPWNPDANTWGNPHNAYVGDVTGANKGYGVYWQPVANMIDNYRPVEVKRGWNTTDLAKTIEAGNPVILWWQNGWSTPTWYHWYTPGGTRIDALQGMHSEVAIGFNGSSDNPTSIIVQDPWRGRRTISISTFKALWSYFNNTGVIVY